MPVANERRIIGYDQDYPGSYRWPVYEIFCPECGQWVKDYGEVDQLINGQWFALCTHCGEKAMKENPELVS
jgi:hypothetical protein